MFDFDDWGSWGIGDFYEANEKELRDALESGQDFDSGWHGFKKEIQSMRIARDFSGVIVEVYAEMDSAFEDWSLITDCLTYEECEKLTDEMVDEIRDCLCADMEYCEDTEDSVILPVNATFEEIVEKASELMEGCDNRLHESFKSCAAITLYVLYGNLKTLDSSTIV